MYEQCRDIFVVRTFLSCKKIKCNMEDEFKKEENDLVVASTTHRILNGRGKFMCSVDFEISVQYMFGM